jgi:hypothetical protein
MLQTPDPKHIQNMHNMNSKYDQELVDTRDLRTLWSPPVS